jgi:hypothetical protein
VSGVYGMNAAERGRWRARSSPTYHVPFSRSEAEKREEAEGRRQGAKEAERRRKGRRRAFTVGLAESYDASISASTPENPLVKCGRYPGYEGGWVWATAREAEAFLASAAFAEVISRSGSEFGVYRLELPTNWAADVSPIPHSSDGVHRLRNDALIIERVGVKPMRKWA